MVRRGLFIGNSPCFLLSCTLGCAPIKDSLGSMLSCSESCPWDAGWTEILFSPSDVISALGPLWSSRSEFTDRELKAFSMLFSDFLISSFNFRIISVAILKDISSTCSSVKLFVSVSSHAELQWGENSSFLLSPSRVFLLEVLVGN